MRVLLASLAVVVLATACSSSPPQPLTDAGPLPAPTVTSIDPASGPKSGGTVVSVLGTNFVAGAQLLIGDAPATQVTVVSDRRLTGSSPVSPVSGLVDVKVVNPDGQSAVLSQAFRVIPPPDERTEVDSCELLSPQSFSVGEGSTSITAIVGTVTAIGVTDSAGQGPAITGEVGYGPLDAGIDTSRWTWAPANYDDGQSGSTFDAYAANIVAPARGDYLFAYRFQYDGGTWTYCDLNGSEAGGFTADQVGHMTVTGPQVDWCNLQWPPAASSSAGQPATLPDGGPTSADGPGLIYSHVWKNGVTNDPGQGPGIWSQMGVGPADSGPGSAGWTWKDASFNPTCTTCNNGHDDEYEAQLVGPQYGGNYAYTFRYKVDGGDWIYCNQTGLIPGTATNGLGELTNSGPQPISPTVDWCNVETASSSAIAGQPTGAITSQVQKTGVTEPDAGMNSALISGELGIGAANTAPRSAGWSWTPAQFAQSGLGPFGTNYRYTATATAPANAGTYAYAYRYQYQGGPYVYCDTAGPSDAGTANLGVLTVSPAPTGTVDCALESLSAGAVSSGAPLTAVAHIYSPGITDATGQGAGLKVQAGVGAWGFMPSQPGWGWENAAYLDDSDGGTTDRYTAVLTAAYTGDRSVTFRVSADDGGTWHYCDATQVPDAGYLKVNSFAATGGMSDCKLQYPAPNNGGTLTSAGTVVYGHVTSTTAASAITAQLGVGSASEDPGVGLGWTWADAGQNATCTSCGTNVYEFDLPFPTEPSGSYNYAYRYTLDGGSWCYGDQTGTSDGFSGSDMGSATLP